MNWQPLNLTDVCPTNSSLTVCSPFGFVYMNLMFQMYGRSVGDRMQDSCETSDDSSNEYDFIVVGAGSAGCVVANRLSENPNWTVLLLEAGPEQPEMSLFPYLSPLLRSTNIVSTYTTEPNGKSCLARPGGRCGWLIGQTMGGSSSVNGLVYIRGNKADFDGWAALGNEGWSYGDVLPFFIKSEKNMNIKNLNRKYHGDSGELFVSWYPYTDKPSLGLIAAFKEIGLSLTDFNGADQEGTMQAQATAFSGIRVSTNTAFIQPVRCKRKNLTIKSNSETLKILIDKNKKAYGVVYSYNGQKIPVYAKKEVIISAGAVHSPKLLMLSGIGPRDNLKKAGITMIQESAVGKNLHDHVSFNGLYIAFSNETAPILSEEEMLEAIQEHAEMKIKRGPLAANGPLNTIAFIKTNSRLIAPDIQYQCLNIYKWREYFVDPLTAESLAIFPTAYYDSILPMIVNIAPKSRGVLLLNESDPNGPPILHPNYFGDESDLTILLKAAKILLSLEDTEVFKSIGAYFVRKAMPACTDFVWGTDDYIACLARAYTITYTHYAGSCKMGPKWDKEAVVDNELRVYGVCGLRVIDASIMPSIVRGNSNAASIMIGERGVDYVIKYWQQHNEACCTH